MGNCKLSRLLVFRVQGHCLKCYSQRRREGGKRRKGVRQI